MKQTFILKYPELNTQRREPLTEEQIRKNKEYSELKRERTRKAANERMVEEQRFRQFSMSRTSKPDTSIADVGSERTRYRSIGEIKESLLNYRIPFENMRKLDVDFVDDHPISLDNKSYYEDIPIYINLNMVSFEALEKPFIFGYLKGCIFIDNSKRISVGIQIHTIVDDVTLRWLYDTHKELKLRITDSNKFFLKPERRIRDNTLPRVNNPFNQRLYSELDSIEVSKLLDAEKREAKKVKVLKEKKEGLIVKLSHSEHYLNISKPNSPGYTQYDTEVKEFRKELAKIKNDLAEHKEALNAAGLRIAEFHETHRDTCCEDGWATVWHLATT